MCASISQTIFALVMYEWTSEWMNHFIESHSGRQPSRLVSQSVCLCGWVWIAGYLIVFLNVHMHTYMWVCVSACACVCISKYEHNYTVNARIPLTTLNIIIQLSSVRYGLNEWCSPHDHLPILIVPFNCKTTIKSIHFPLRL